MLNIAVCVSGGGTNLQAIIDRIADGTLENVKIAGVISNNKNAYALERAAKADIPAFCVSPKDFETREAFHDALAAADAEEYMIQVDLTTASQFKIVKLDGFKIVEFKDVGMFQCEFNGFTIVEGSAQIEVAYAHDVLGDRLKQPADGFFIVF